MPSSPTYSTWSGMKARCGNPTNISYRKYGARGITVCERWMEFRNFLADMGERPAGTTLDRIDTTGNYEPGNCRWATPKQQRHNSRQTVEILEHNGRRQCLTDWSKEVGIHVRTLWKRIHISGWPVERALSTPICKLRRKSL